MKQYIKPTFEFVELRPEENLAGEISAGPTSNCCKDYITPGLPCR